ncbi:DUF4340 domain-containing protein [Nostoc sp. FACHB-152]|uniref:DUF4340 domain-containing protein n=1 Tax=unclassified Nostoc TaxID=2593658 RepID=UPI0016897A0F|nr:MULTISPECIES: DUF4340 domain-containing protein [unclassified Nostoc]MBD2445694.1 DUF4340 domain-containing protein [Nostoc sp. FACHB-152]MBD2466808.1 DUF4340 domain-containing protein [Nostoc sp. FACHB-145]
MKLPRTTLILVFLALGLGGFVYFYEIKGATQREEAKEKQQQIFSFAEDDIQSLTVQTKNNTVVLERNNQSSNPKWLLKSPVSQPGNDAIVAYLTDLLVKGKSNNTLSIPANQLGEFGLNQPQATIKVNLKNQKTHQLVLGKSDFNNRFVYAQADSATQPNGNLNVLLVSTDFQNAVNRELSEWQQPANNSPSTPLPSLNLPTPAKTP